MKVSVCMAAYNGEIFIHEQIASILEPELGRDDEIVIVDDALATRRSPLLKAFVMREFFSFTNLQLRSRENL